MCVCALWIYSPDAIPMQDACGNSRLRRSILCEYIATFRDGEANRLAAQNAAEENLQRNVSINFNVYFNALRASVNYPL